MKNIGVIGLGDMGSGIAPSPEITTLLNALTFL